MSELFNGSLCLTDLLDFAKKAHSAYSRGKNNGKAYVSVQIWLNEEIDTYGNCMSIKLNSAKGKKDVDRKLNGGKDIYIGNAKLVDVGDNPSTNGKATKKTHGHKSDIDPASDGLPF